MEKYLIIIILAVILYTIYKNCSTTEAFGDVSQSVVGIDDQNAINTLAQVAKSLQSGGLTVPGNLIIDGEFTQKNVNMVKGPNANRFIFHTPDDNRKGLWIAPAKDDGASDWLWGNGLNLKRDGNHYLGGNLDIGGITTRAVNVWHQSKDAKNRVYYENAGTTYYGSGNGKHIFRLGGEGNGGEVIIDQEGSITLPGYLIRNNPIYRKHDVAGYFQIRAYGLKVPIYYGFNMFWRDHNLKEALRNKNGWPEFMINNVGIDMREAHDGDQNWTARYLTVFPGYKVRLYSWGGNNLDARDEPVRGVGEYPFPDTSKRIHAIYVALSEETDPSKNIYW